MRYKIPLTLVLSAVAVLLAGCAQQTQGEATSMQPLTAPQQEQDTDLGPGTRPLSNGPGNKSSPSWSPSGENIAAIIDGYVAEKSSRSSDFERQTTRDFNATRVEWVFSEKGLFLLGSGKSEAPAQEKGFSLYRTLPGDSGSLGLEKLQENTLAISSTADKRNLIAAYRSSPNESRLALVRRDEKRPLTYPRSIEGTVTGLSVSADGAHAALAVREKDGRFAIYDYHLSEGEPELLTRLDKDQKVSGAPQWTVGGIYYIAGKKDETGDRNNLYRLPPDSRDPRPVSVVGKDFVASSLKSSPDREELAILGRRSSGSSTNLYLLRPKDASFNALTSNDGMKIKTGGENMAWSPDGESVVIVAQSSSSETGTYDKYADELLKTFYNLYEVPVR